MGAPTQRPSRRARVDRDEAIAREDRAIDGVRTVHASRALAPAELVHESAVDSSFARTRALNAARAACAADGADARAYERYVALAGEACDVLETKPCGVGDEAVALRWRSAPRARARLARRARESGIARESAFALFGLAGSHRARGKSDARGGTRAGGDEREIAAGASHLANEATAVASDARDVSSEPELTGDMSRCVRCRSGTRDCGETGAREEFG